MWPWAYALSPEPVVMVPGQGEYPLDVKVKRVLAVVETNQRYPLVSIAQSDWARRQAMNTSQSRPTEFTFTRGTLFIFPVPDVTDTLDVFYYEHPEWADDDEAIPPFESSFHTAIVDWGLVRLWEQEEDFEKSGEYRQRFELKMNRMQKFYDTEFSERPMIYGQQVGMRPTSMPWLGDANLGGATG
jgi:hypothetical protein